MGKIAKNVENLIEIHKTFYQETHSSCDKNLAQAIEGFILSRDTSLVNKVEGLKVDPTDMTRAKFLSLAEVYAFNNAIDAVVEMIKTP